MIEYHVRVSSFRLRVHETRVAPYHLHALSSRVSAIIPQETKEADVPNICACVESNQPASLS